MILAVSGGLDSVCLAHLAAAARVHTRLGLATFDHASGAHSAAAVEFVVALAARLGLPVHVGRATHTAYTESEWRASRWAFLREIAARQSAMIATAHTADDHLETVVMRLLRGSGARGLAGLHAPSPGVIRPLLGVDRADLANYAQQAALAWVEDPTNQSRRFLRNRVRLDLLPALRQADPSLPAHLGRLSREAADLRRRAERLAAAWVVARPQGVRVSDEVLALPDRATRAFAWPAALGPGGVTLDRRGIERISQLDHRTIVGSRVPLAGGWVATRVVGGVDVAREPLAPASGLLDLPGMGSARFGSWGFHVSPDVPETVGDDPWRVALPAEAALSVRSWRDGDRIAAGAGGRPRRVKRFFADLKIPAWERQGWPVVVADGEIIWIPGVRRASAASVRSGRPARFVVCERLSR